MMHNQEELAELIGIILGDGHLHTTQNRITIVGSLEDLKYYQIRVIPLFESLFHLKPILRKRNDRNAYYLEFTNKQTFEFLTKDIGLIRGNKVNALIPAFIISDKKLIPHFLRGLFDTDGCIKFSKQGRNVNYYPRVQFCFRDTIFAESLKKLLEKTGFGASQWKEKRGNGLIFYQISGKENLERWMKLVNPANPVHKTKYLFWKKFGFYTPKSGLEHRLKALDLNMD